MNYTTLIDVPALAKHLDDPSFIVFDCRHDLAKPHWGSEVYEQSHLPGARFAHLDKNLSGSMTGKNGRHPLPDAQVFAQWLGQMGVSNATQVVGYDSTGGTYGARLWWMLRWLGHDGIAVLDGGWDAWLKAGLPVTNATPKPSPAHFDAKLRNNTRVDAEFVFAHLGKKEVCVLDARANDRFHGQNETIDPIAGHIPGAKNRFFKNNLDTNGCFKSPAVLKTEFQSLLGSLAPGQIVNQCGSGVTACHNALAMEIAGFKGSKLYPGSWSEWIADPTRPIATD